MNTFERGKKIHLKYKAKIDKNDLGKCGIYCIQNIVNQKVYIGKSKNIYARIRAHIFGLRKKIKNENRHLINA